MVLFIATKGLDHGVPPFLEIDDSSVDLLEVMSQPESNHCCDIGFLQKRENEGAAPCYCYDVIMGKCDPVRLSQHVRSGKVAYLHQLPTQ